MVRVAGLLTFLTFVVLSEARHEPGYCAFYEECGRNPLIENSLITPVIPCLNYSPARHLAGEHYRKLKKVCPMLDQGENNTYACCSINQLSTLETRLALSAAPLHHCPSCYENFAHLHCINTCSPNQSQILKVSKVLTITSFDQTEREAVAGYEAFVSTTFADAAYLSCKNVRIPATGFLVMDVMCGDYGARLCKPQHWYDFQGDSSDEITPTDIVYNLIREGDTAGLPEGVIPYNGRALKCSEKTPSGGAACSCRDCQESCRKL